MKKLYFILFFTTFSFYGFSQPIITMIMDGDCSGGNPKMLEIYAAGTVDFSLYSLQNQTNGNTTWGSTTNLAAFGTVTNGFVYVTTTGSETAIGTDLPSVTYASAVTTGAINVNGDDRVRIILDSDSSVVDVYGVDSQDGTGEVWEYKDSYAKRNNNAGPNPTFTASEWTFGGVSALNTLGVCQGGTDTFETLIGGVGTYTNTTLSLDTPRATSLGMYPNPTNTGSVTISSSSNENIEVTVFDMLGKQVKKEVFNTNTTLDVSDLKTGVYLVNISQNGNSTTKKLIIN